MRKQPNILIVSETVELRKELEQSLTDAGYHTAESDSRSDALLRLQHGRVDLVICDVEFSGMEDLLLFSGTRATVAQLPFVLITSYASVPKAVTAIKAGATDYITTPFTPDTLLDTVSRLTTLPTEVTELVLADAKSKQQAELARRVAQSNATIMISGESGTGKEVFARFIHDNSPRSHKPFVAINCAAIPETMLESMLFGYEKGAYTGAVTARAGKFEQANGGTLLLDEISEMDLGLQAKLLRVIQEREVERLGSNRSLKLDVRLIATTNRNLKAEVAAGRFREDLYYRLNVFPLALAPLRQRREDIIPLAQTFLARHQGARTLELDATAKAALLQHHWAGNVRELENVIQRAVILAIDGSITLNELIFESQPPSENLDDVTPAIVIPPPPADLQHDLKHREQELIIDAICSQHSRKAAAEKLGISPRTLRYKIAQFRKAGVAIPA